VAINKETMRNLLLTISLIFIGFSSGCVNIDSKDTIRLKTGLDSIYYSSIKNYCFYLDTFINKFGGDKKYCVLIESCKSLDTLSYLITCNTNDDISTIIHDSLTYVFKVDNHFVFSKTVMFSNYYILDFDNVLMQMDKVAYDNYRQNGTKPMIKAMWDCAFLYLVVKDKKILRKEIRYFETEPKMWKNSFWN
jgi:hypothetical protein